MAFLKKLNLKTNQMNININDSKFDEKEMKAIFNKGNAGVARNCSAKMTKRGADDNPNGPAYKLLFTDNDEAVIDRPFFTPKEEMTEVQSTFFVKEMKHLMSQAKIEWEKADFNSYNEMLTYVINATKDAVEKNKFGVAVSYGTIKKPSQYLNVDGFWGFRNEENISEAKPLSLSKNAILNRIEPKGPSVNTGDDWSANAPKDDLPF